MLAAVVFAKKIHKHYDGKGKSVTADNNVRTLSMIKIDGTLNLGSNCILKNNCKESGLGSALSVYGTVNMNAGASIM